VCTAWGLSFNIWISFTRKGREGERNKSYLYVVLTFTEAVSVTRSNMQIGKALECVINRILELTVVEVFVISKNTVPHDNKF
jgi:hypothetical protein